MKLKLEFTAEIIEEVGDVDPNELCRVDRHKAALKEMLKTFCGESATITVRECKLTNLSQ